jgi:hypothetical protein
MKRIKIRRHKRRTKKSGAVIVRSHYRKLNTPTYIDKGKICGPDDIKRKCWECKTPLNWSEFSKMNQDIPDDELTKLWMSLETEFYCCKCFNEQKRQRFLAFFDKPFKEKLKIKGVVLGDEVYYEKAKEIFKWALKNVEKQNNFEFLISEYYPYHFRVWLTKIKHPPPNYNIDYDVINTNSGRSLDFGSIDFENLEDISKQFSAKIKEYRFWIFDV